MKTVLSQPDLFNPPDVEYLTIGYSSFDSTVANLVNRGYRPVSMDVFHRQGAYRLTAVKIPDKPAQ